MGMYAKSLFFPQHHTRVCGLFCGKAAKMRHLSLLGLKLTLKRFCQTGPCTKQATNEQITQECCSVLLKKMTSLNERGLEEHCRMTERHITKEEEKRKTERSKIVSVKETVIICSRVTRVHCPASLISSVTVDHGRGPMSSLRNWFLVLISLCLTQIGWFY